MTKYRLISIGKREDCLLDENILFVELTPIRENKLLKGYSFYESDKKVFIFLLEEKHKDYFLINPEEIKYLNLNNFEMREFKLSHLNSIKAYLHFDYIKKYEEILERRRRGKKLKEIIDRISKNKKSK